MFENTTRALEMNWTRITAIVADSFNRTHPPRRLNASIDDLISDNGSMDNYRLSIQQCLTFYCTHNA